MPSGIDLALYSGLDLDLDGSYVKSTGGTISEQSSVSIDPEIVAKYGSTIKGYYPTISAALSYVSSGYTVRVYSS